MTAVIFTMTEVRPNLTVNFIREDMSFINYIQKFNDSRKRNDPAGWIISQDLLTRTIAHTFTSKEDLTTYLNDPVVAARMSLRDAYNVENGITGTKVES